MPKKITVASYGPIAVSSKYESPWEDVYLSWTAKPGRKKYRIAPCLCSKSEAEREHRINLKCRAENPEMDWSDDINHSTLALEAIALKGIYIDGPDSDIPNVYSPAEFIDRIEAERMIAEVMKLHGFNSIRCKWKRPKIVVIPV